MEKRVEIEAEFLKSWDKIEEFYSDLFSYKGWDYTKPIMPVISQLRSMGYDKTLRAGQSLYTFVLSRSRNWGLKDDQHSLKIEPTTQNEFKVWYSDGQNSVEKLRTDNLLNNNTFWKLLDQLKQLPID